ncbi:MAG: methylthioribulose 1-phosphate dehydratase [Acidobacteria bacterium]|nr:MAG: methylthioribulose 1-phosphate dehydratase [Acidobacteriota bacterium]
MHARRLRRETLTTTRAKRSAPHSVYDELAERIAELGRQAHHRGWVLGTSGNFSAVVSRDPLRLAITASGVDKGRLGPAQVLEIDGEGRAVRGGGRPSAETSLHLAIVRARGAGAVLHTHSPWSTLLSDAHAGAGGLAIEGYEMLKGLDGVATHEHREWLPIVENTQDWSAGAAGVEAVLRQRPDAHGLLIRRHGLYTWGRDFDEAVRHLEVLEFLLEVVGRSGEKGDASWRA